jgi:branched-chain amino acid transport system substrate-binding protein
MRRRTLKQMVLLLTAGLALSALVAGACGKDEGGGSPTTPGDSRALPGTMQGVTDTEVRIGTLLPLTGTAAAWGVGISRGMQAYFDYINDEGGMYGRQLKLYVGDSGYSGPVAAEAVRRLVEQDKVFMLQGNLGTEVESAVYQYLEERGIPDMYILTGASKFTVPVVRTRFSGLVDYATEGRILARYVFQNFDGKKLGIIAQNDDYGKEGVAGMRQGFEELGADVDVTVEYYDATQSEVTAQVQRLKVDNVDVMAFWGAPVQAANMIKTARSLLSWDVPMIINGTNALDITGQLAGYDNIEGTVSTMIGHQAWETNIPTMAESKRLMAKYAPDLTFDNTSLVGWVISAGVAGLIKQAGPNLTRETFLDAAESVCKFTSETGLVPLSTSATDHRATEAEILARAVVDRSTDPPTFRWETFGDPIDFESTKDCVVPTPPPDATSQPGPPLQGEPPRETPSP